MKPTLNDLGKLLKQPEIKGDRSLYGVVVDKVTDENGFVTDYMVSLGDADNLIKCRKFVGAEIGDVVMATLLSNGTTVVANRRDGDGDAISFIEGARDGTVNINGKCLDSIGDADHVTVSPDAIALVGTETQFTVANGTITAAHNGRKILTTKSATAETQTYTASVGVEEGHSKTVVIPTGAIRTVTAKIDNRFGLIHNSSTRVLTTDSTQQIYYSQAAAGQITIHVASDIDLRHTTVNTIEVVYDAADSYIFEIGDRKLYTDANGNTFAKSFTQVNAPVTSTAPNTNNGGESTSSSRKVKHDIKDCEIDVHALYDIPVRQFKFNEDYLDENDERFGKDVIGLVAEEVDEHLPIAVDHTDIPMWNSHIIIPAMLKLIQEQHEEIEKLKETVSGL